LRVLIPRTIQQIIITGEQSGHLAASLKKIGQIYETKTETSTKNITVILEPILLVIVWVGVVTVALSVVLPIYSLIGGLNSGAL
jgi:type IV pilus assembly protein PilC